jgi:hypothetical protein
MVEKSQTNSKEHTGWLDMRIIHVLESILVEKNRSFSWI